MVQPTPRLLSLAVALLLGFGAAASARPILVTIDDLPIVPRSSHDRNERAELTGRWLNLLAARNIRTIAFVRAAGIAGDEVLLQRWLKGGHLLGNHTWSHPSLSRVTADEFIADAEKARSALATLQKGPVKYFRFPYLRWGNTPNKLAQVRRWLEQTGQVNVPVTIDTSDWRFNADWLKARGAARDVIAADYLAHLRTMVRRYNRLGDDVHGRETPAVLLLHANAIGAEHIGPFFDWLLAEGHTIVGPEILEDPALSDQPALAWDYGTSLWWRQRTVRDREAARSAIAAGLAESTDAWNRGDLDRFVADYVSDARFVSAKGVTRGRAEVLARYKKRYPDKAAMGTLTLDVLEVRFPNPLRITVFSNVEPARLRDAVVIGRWQITRADGTTLSGHTLLVFEKRGGRWWIVEDMSA